MRQDRTEGPLFIRLLHLPHGQKRARQRGRNIKSAVWFTLLAGAMVFQQCVLLLAGSGLVSGFYAPIPILRPLSHRRPTLSVSSTTNEEALGTSVSTAGSEDAIDWNKQWYPVLSLKDTDTGRAHAVQVRFRKVGLFVLLYLYIRLCT